MGDAAGGVSHALSSAGTLEIASMSPRGLERDQAEAAREVEPPSSLQCQGRESQVGPAVRHPNGQRLLSGTTGARRRVLTLWETPLARLARTGGPARRAAGTSKLALAVAVLLPLLLAECLCEHRDAPLAECGHSITIIL